MTRLRSSVASCTCNGARFIAAQVRSLFAQTRPVDEIVVVDDASDDATFGLLQALARESPVPMRVFRNAARLGVVRNFERAMALARGDVIFLCDQDDVWEAEKIQLCMAEIEADARTMLVHSNAQLTDAELAPLTTSLFEAIAVTPLERELEDQGCAFEMLLKRNIVTGATMAVRREVFETALPFADGWVHDEWLAIFASLLGRLVRIERPLVRYRQHAANQIGAAARTPVQRLETLLGSPGDYQRRQFARLKQLHARMATLRPAPDARRLSLVATTLAHAKVRASLAAPRWRRIPLVMQETLNRRYFRYSRGWTSIARDLIGPIRA